MYVIKHKPSKKYIKFTKNNGYDLVWSWDATTYSDENQARKRVNGGYSNKIYWSTIMEVKNRESEWREEETIRQKVDKLLDVLCELGIHNHMDYDELFGNLCKYYEDKL